MILLAIVFTLMHTLLSLYFRQGWGKIQPTHIATSDKSFSIIIPVRNEESVIEKLLTCIAFQEYPKDKFEVLVVDDFSEDKTAERVKAIQTKFDINIQLISLDNPETSGKKYALTKGVESARFDYILTTDADCQMGPQWIASYAASFKDNEFMAGPVALKGGGLFANIQQVEFAGLLGFGAVTLSKHNPSMCSGANLGFTKKAFKEVGGYENNIQIPSGDDEFLLYNVLKKYPGKASFLKNKSAVVLTPAQQSIRRFINQRIRWTSKWKHNKNWKTRLAAILFFFDYVTLIALIIGTISGAYLWYYLPILLLVRTFSDGIFTNPISRFLGNRSNITALIAMQIIYPFHVLLMGLNSIFGSYTWKGRKY